MTASHQVLAKTPSLRTTARRALWTALAILFCAGAGGAFAIGFTRALTAGLVADGLTPNDQIAQLAHALSVAQIVSVAALAAIAMLLFGMAWFVRAKLIAPMQFLRRSLEDSILLSGKGLPPNALWGMNRRDEIGALARTIERLRVPAEALKLASHRPSIAAIEGSAEKLTRAAARVEHALFALTSQATATRDNVQLSCVQAARASQTALEAANLAREGIERKLKALPEGEIGKEAEAARAAMTDAAKKLAELAQRFAGRAAEPAPAAVAAPAAPAPGGGGMTLDRLLTELEALEKSALGRATLDVDQATLLTAGLIDVIDRLNQVAELVSAAADHIPAPYLDLNAYRGSE